VRRIDLSIRVSHRFHLALLPWLSHVRIEQDEGGDMRKRLTKVGVTIAALAALAVGGSAVAGAAQNSGPAKAKAPAASQSSEPAVPDTDNVQQGDQSAPDNPSEQASEQPGSESESSSESGPSDGPGGYADSNANADTQQQGEH
jgi:hypothetical protein